MRSIEFLFTTACLIVAFSTLSFAAPVGIAEMQEQREVRFEEASREQAAEQQHEKDATANADVGASSPSSSTAERGTEVLAVDPSLSEHGYLTREVFVDSLNQDIAQWNHQLEAEYSGEKVISGVKILILTQAVNAAKRLSLKYSDILSSAPGEENQGIVLPSVRTFQELAATRISPFVILPRQRMTELEFDQEFYGAIKNVMKEALQYSENDQRNAALDCLDDMNYLDGYSRLRFDRDRLFVGLRSMILKNYEKLIVQSSKPGEIGRAEVTSEEQEAAHRLMGCTKLWDFENDFELNKTFLKKMMPSLMATLPEGQTLQGLIESEKGPMLFQEFNKTTLQLPAVLQGFKKPIVIVSSSEQPDKGSSGVPLPGVGERELAFKVLTTTSRQSWNIDNNINDARAFNEALFRMTASLSTLTVLAAALAYEYYLHSLRESSKAASS